ncbi:CHAT domain-containing protein [Fusarium sp. LHS14.1]|nr:CHAT domain-containing protein [Fusarium sp. LHS14.1]
MEFDGILDVFGGCLCPEEYRRSFNDIEQKISEIDANSDDHLLLRAIFAAMKGNFKASDDYFEILRTLGCSEAFRTRIRHYVFFCKQMARHPPALRFREEMRSFTAIFNETRLGIAAATQDMQSSREGVELSPIQTLECDILEALWRIGCFLPKFGRMNHPLYPNTALAMRSREIANNCSFDSLRSSANRAAVTGLHDLERHCQNLALECHFGHHACGREDAKAAAESLLAKCRETHDRIGIALSYIRRADALLSPPFTNPIALNFILDGMLSGWDVPEWDSVEASFRLSSNEEAIQLYCSAMEEMGHAGSTRGQGLVYLRLACIAEWKGLHNRERGRLQSDNQNFEEARRHLDLARHCYQDDVTNSQIVAVHGVVLDILSCKHLNALQSARRIGQDSASHGNVVVAQFAGIFLLRLARYLHQDLAATETAVVCCQCARECFRGAGETFLEFQAVLSEIIALERSSERAAIRCTEAQALVKATLGQFEGFGNLGRKLQSQILLHAGKVIRGALHADYNRLESWNRDFHKYESEVGLYNTMRSVLSDSSISTERPLDDVVQNVQQGEELQARYAQVQQCYDRALDRCEVTEAENYWREFLRELNNREEHLACFMRFISLLHLGKAAEAKDMLGSLLPPAYGGHGKRVDWQYTKYIWSGNDSQFFQEGLEQDRMAEIEWTQFESSLHYVNLAADWERGKQVLEVAARRRILPLKPDKQGILDWQIKSKVAAIHEHTGSHMRAFEEYSAALDSLERRIIGLSDVDSRQNARSTIHTSVLYEGLARTALYFSQQSSSPMFGATLIQGDADWKAKALEYLERGRARALFDLLVAQRHLSELDKDLLQQWCEKEYSLRKFLEAQKGIAGAPPRSDVPSADVDELKREAALARSALESHAPEIAEVLAINRFHLPVEEVFRQLQPRELVIHTHLSRHGLILFGITQKGINLVHRSETRDIDVRRLALSYNRCLRISLDPLSREKLATISAKLADILLVPCSNILEDTDHIIFVRAAALEVSETPSLAVLHTLMQTAKNRAKASNKISIIADPHRDGTRGDPAPMVGIGALSLASKYQTEAQNPQSVSSEAFRSQFQESQIVHISTHGTVFLDAPWQSSLVLQEEFKVMDLIRLQSKASLIVFAACVSGLGRTTSGNDVTGFSHAVLQSGASAYIGALRQVDSLASMVLIHVFHKQLRSHGDAVSIAECWRRAQAKLYRANTAIFRDLLREVRESIDQEAAKAFGMPEARDLLDDVIGDLEDEDFSHPGCY